MGHLMIAYDFFVIAIGIAALLFSILWAARSGEAYLSYFCVLYAVFTLFLIASMLKEYVFLNIADFPPRAAFFIQGIITSLNFEIVLAAILFLHELYGVRKRGILAVVFAAAIFAANVLLFAPGGGDFREASGEIVLGGGFYAAEIVSICCFTYAIIIGFSLMPRAGGIGRLPFAISLLVFASIGYGESLIGTIISFSHPVVAVAGSANGFVISSIPYALYGIFLILYFSRHEPAVLASGIEPSKRFRTRYGITDREEEIVIRVIQGQSNAKIAEELFISLSTVKTHVHNIFMKTGVKGRYGLIHKIRESAR